MITPVYADGPVTVFQGDCVEVMRQLPDQSVDAVVTDPPYALEFMGKGWDRFTPGEFQHWCEDWARECLRLLKPGGHLLAFGGTRTFHRLAAGVEDAGFEIRDSIAWLYGSGFPKSLNLTGDWQGWGTALKPAFEPVVVARKPLAGTVASNVLAYGTGALNVEACRIGVVGGRTVHTSSAGEHRDRWAGNRSTGVVTDNGGRWPANVVLDESQAAALDAQSGITRDGVAVTRNIAGQSHPVDGATSIGVSMRYSGVDFGYGGEGGASRFFYTAKASTAERPSADGVAHPTVKPLDLMRWLVRLVTPPGGMVLEPFAGSGTTVEACLREGFSCVAVEREAEYVPLILKRVRKPHQVGFDFDV